MPALPAIQLNILFFRKKMQLENVQLSVKNLRLFKPVSFLNYASDYKLLAFFKPYYKI